jgi:hypothetical protein
MALAVSLSMKSLLTTLIFAVIGFNSMATSTTINAVLGDQSFIEKHGYVPNSNTDDNLRIRTHLEFVEANLRMVSTEHLSSSARINREELLDRLHEYWTANIFPSPSISYEGRKPCFIDSDGNICAVGYLIEMASGREVAEHINSKYKFEYLLKMNDPVIDNWASEHGFSLDELAQIQPTYDGWYTPRIAPVTYTIVDQGPSKKELALQAELDSLHPILDSVTIALDSTLKVTVSQQNSLSSLEDKHDQSLEKGKKEKAKSKDSADSQKTIIYILTGALALMLGFTIFTQIRARRNS